MTKKRQFSFIALALILLSVSLLPACGAGATPGAHGHAMAPLEEMPVTVQRLARETQEAYQFSVANRELADAVPCYCGCIGLGHTSSYDCYVAGKDESGALVFDTHAEYCTICVDITQDAMRMLDEGKSTPGIVAQIEVDYSPFGPPTEKAQAGES